VTPIIYADFAVANNSWRRTSRAQEVQLSGSAVRVAFPQSMKLVPRVLAVLSAPQSTLDRHQACDTSLSTSTGSWKQENTIWL